MKIRPLKPIFPSLPHSFEDILLELAVLEKFDMKISAGKMAKCGADWAVQEH